MQERLFDPLGMNTTKYGDSRVVVKGRGATAYSRQSGELRNWIWPYAITDYPTAWVAHCPAEHLSVIVLCNLAGARADELQYDIVDMNLED
jgi:hypothetical protein